MERNNETFNYFRHVHRDYQNVLDNRYSYEGISMNNINPKVSIVLPIYNGARYMRQSIDSCLNQTYKNIELIIIEDGSTDDTVKIIKNYNDHRITLIQHEKNKGLPTALNTGFKYSTGEYLTWTSDDNYYCEDAIKKMVEFIMNIEGDFVFANYYIIEDNITNKTVNKMPQIMDLKNQNYIGGCFLYSRKVKDVIGDYDSDIILVEDYDYWIRISKKFKMRYLKEPIYYYRIHRNALSSQKNRDIDLPITVCLVKTKNQIFDNDYATSFIIGYITNRIMKRYNINERNVFFRPIYRIIRLVCRLLYSEKIYKLLLSYTNHEISFKQAWSNIKEIFLRN